MSRGKGANYFSGFCDKPSPWYDSGRPPEAFISISAIFLPGPSWEGERDMVGVGSQRPSGSLQGFLPPLPPVEVGLSRASGRVLPVKHLA